jgi:hypothetical protein
MERTIMTTQHLTPSSVAILRKLHRAGKPVSVRGLNLRAISRLIHNEPPLIQHAAPLPKAGDAIAQTRYCAITLTAYGRIVAAALPDTDERTIITLQEAS